jgi:transposase InsO family protein
LLRGLKITRPSQVWSTDITYVPMQNGFMYLVAILDWFSRYVLAWQLSNTLDGLFCHRLRAGEGRGQGTYRLGGRSPVETGRSSPSTEGGIPPATPSVESVPLMLLYVPPVTSWSSNTPP